MHRSTPSHAKGGRFKSSHSGPGRPPQGGRRPPPEWTGKEADYLQAQKENNAPVLLRLRDGRTVCGVIEYYDRDMVKLQRPAGPHLFIRKSDIRYMQEETPPQPPPRPR